ncbi:MAG TPA: O-antigen polymerase [Blastocatellia bacterium]|nr:O-antigen polymerase [Blastocatellia bacterium]
MVFELTLYDDVTSALVIDLVVLLFCTILLLRYGRLAHSHPAVIYLFFHVIVISSRLLAIMAGAETLFSKWGGFYEPVTEAELARATILADIVLIVMTIACIRASQVDLKRINTKPEESAATATTLSLRHIWTVVGIAFPVGVIGVALVSNVPGFEKPDVDFGEWQESSWLSITTTWAGLSLLALIYWYGFRLWLVAPMVVYLFIMSVQGFHRFRAVIPLILLLQIYLDRRQKKWPPSYVTALIFAAMLLFYPMKSIGRMAQEGATVNEISESSTEILREVAAGQNGDQTLLDQFASSLTLIDRAEKFYYGSTYLALLTSPIPRQFWPEKPGLADYQKDFSTPSRPMSEMGMTVTFMGEFYLNFGNVGVVIMSFLTAYWLARIYFRGYRSSYYSVLRFSYLLIACNLIQVYRDGLMSLFVFTLVNMMPLSIIVFLHLVRPLRARPEAVPLYGLPLSPK